MGTEFPVYGRGENPRLCQIASTHTRRALNVLISCSSGEHRWTQGQHFSDELASGTIISLVYDPRIIRSF